MDVVAITELEKIDATRVDGVGVPANGIPILLMKSLPEPAVKAPVDEDGSTDGPTHGAFTGKHKHPHAGAGGEMFAEEHSHDGDGDHSGHDHAAKSEFDHAAALALVKAIVGRKVDESPDIAGGTAVLAQIADLIIAEAQELKAGNAGEICDIQQLACAAEMIWCWRTGEEAVASGSVQPATALMQSAAESAIKAAELGIISLNDAAEIVLKSGPSAEERRQAASEGNALPDGSYPIRNAHDLHSAAVLARSGHGDVAAAKRLIARRAKELGVANPLDTDDDTSKSQIAPEVPAVDTVTQETGSLTKAVEEAVAKATAPLEKLRRELEETIAKAKATPVPSGLVLSRNVQVKQPGTAANEDLLAKAAYYRQKAADAVAPVDRESYLALARETEQAARTKSA